MGQGEDPDGRRNEGGVTVTIIFSLLFKHNNVRKTQYLKMANFFCIEEDEESLSCTEMRVHSPWSFYSA